MQTRILPAQDPEDIRQAVHLAAAALRQGDLVAFPTDTIYGLGADLFNERAIRQLYRVKDRNPNKAIAVLLSDPQELKLVTAEMTGMAQRLAQRFWPGPLTLVVPKQPGLPESISPLPTVGVRMPNHPVALALLRLTGPLAVTSANLSGEADARTAAEALQQLEGRIALVLDGGAAPGGAPSGVVDCTGSTPVILRSGLITLQEMLAALE